MEGMDKLVVRSKREGIDTIFMRRKEVKEKLRNENQCAIELLNNHILTKKCLRSDIISRDGTFYVGTAFKRYDH